jgi:hypothetical protein
MQAQHFYVDAQFVYILCSDPHKHGANPRPWMPPGNSHVRITALIESATCRHQRYGTIAAFHLVNARNTACSWWLLTDSANHFFSLPVRISLESNKKFRISTLLRTSYRLFGLSTGPTVYQQCCRPGESDYRSKCLKFKSSAKTQAQEVAFTLHKSKWGREKYRAQKRKDS